MKEITMVLGMGRSGTSMVSGILEILGVDFGENLHGPNEFNPHGHWENASIVSVNEETLKEMSSNATPQWARKAGGPPKRWLHPSPYNTCIGNKRVPVVEAAILTSFQSVQSPGLKDPRISILWPMWKKALNNQGFKPRIIHVKRNPESVARSLYRFHDFKVPREEALRLCERYNGDVEKYCENERIITIKYESIIESPKMECMRIAHFIEKEYTDEVEQKILNFIDAKLNHS